MREEGVATFVELGPDGSLSALVQRCADDVAALPILRPDRNECVSASSALAQLYTRGVDVDWPEVLGRQAAPPMDLPTYPFQRSRYWLAASSAGSTGPRGLDPVEHPLLTATLPLPGTGGLVLTGEVSTAAQDWLGDHGVLGSILFPGTGFLELALEAADRVGCERIEELTLEHALVVPASGPVLIQVAVAAPDEAGTREITIHSRAAETEWVRHARACSPATRSFSTGSAHGRPRVPTKSR